MTRRAAFFLLVLLTALLVALSTGAQIYYLLVLAMAMMLALGGLSVLLALFTVALTIKCPRRSVERGVSVPVVATVRHMSVLPVKAIQLKLALPGGGEALRAVTLTALPFLTRRYELEIECPHRGLYDIGVERVTVTDVFALFTVSRKIAHCHFQVEVLPRARRLLPLELRAGDMDDNRVTRMTEDNASPADVRQWIQGDALKKVHWKLSMRKRELMVRTYEESAKPDTLVLIDLYPLGSLRSQSLAVEDAVCDSAASIIKAQLSAGYPVRMPLFSAHPAEVSGESDQALDRFVHALTRATFDSAYPFEQVLMLELRRMQRTGGAVLITPRLTARIADLATQMSLGGMSVCVCWVTDNHRDEALDMLSRLNESGIQALHVDPWGDGLTAEQMIRQVQYGR